MRMRIFTAIAAFVTLSGVIVGISTRSAWAYNGDGTCPHDNGTYNSSGCVYGVVTTEVVADPATLTGWDGLGNYTDEIRWRGANVFGGVNAQFAEAGLMEYGTSPGNRYLDLYNGYVDGSGSVHIIVASNPNCTGAFTTDPYHDEVFYNATGSWQMEIWDKNNTSCDLVNDTGNIGIDGGAVAEGGTVFIPGVYGSINDGSIAPNFETWTTVWTGSWRYFSTYITDQPCGAPPCLNGAFYNGNSEWASNLE